MSGMDFSGQHIIIMGSPGSGKSTQAELLARRLQVPHVSTGDIYRALSEENTESGRRIKDILTTGGLIDDSTTFEQIDRHLAKIKGNCVVEGFPRTLVQAERELFPIDKVIYLRLSDEGATRRLSARKREDDTPELIATRLKLYHRDTEPILDYYRRQNKLLEIDASGTIEEVYYLILAALGLTND